MLDLPEAEIQMINLVTDRWLCLQTEGHVYCYLLPEGSITELDA